MINQANIIIDPKQALDGYSNILVSDIGAVTNGYVQNLICNVLDQLTFDQRNQVFVEALKKLCDGGVLTTKFMNLSLLPNKINSGDITGQKLSEILISIQSCWSENEFSMIMSQMKGYSITKLFHDMIYTVVTIQKTK